jgi:plastocyanin
MRFIIAALAGLALAVVPALAADHTVTAKNFQFVEKTITIAPGDAVTWSQSEGNHTVKFADEQSGHPLATPYKRTFDTAGEYAYVCEIHAPDMAGKVVVQAPATTGTTTQTTTTPPPNETTPTTTTTQTTTTPAPPPVVSVKATRTSFCVRRSRRCRRPGVALRISSDGETTLDGTLRRSGRLFGRLRIDVLPGTRTVRFTHARGGRRLARGRYALAFKGLDGVVRFRVR